MAIKGMSTEGLCWDTLYKGAGSQGVLSPRHLVTEYRRRQYIIIIELAERLAPNGSSH